MAQFTFTVPPKAMTAIETAKKYQAFLEDGVTPNPESRNEFVKRIMARILKQFVIACEEQSARESIIAAATDIT